MFDSSKNSNIITKRFAMFVFLLFILVVLTPVSTSQAATVKINKTKLTLIEKETYQLKISGTDKTIAWSSSNKKVASVDKSGKVTVNSKGDATITGSINSSKYTCKITVIETTADSIEGFLDRHYSLLKTDVGNIELNFYVEENEKIYYPFDYQIHSFFDRQFVFDILDSIKYTDDQKEDLCYKLKIRQKNIGNALIKLLPDKKLYGCYFYDYYEYPNIMVDYHYYQYYTWVNFDLTDIWGDSYLEYSLAPYENSTVSKFKWLEEADTVLYYNK